MKAIAYSLFGYNRQREQNSFDFASYLRGFHINIRFNRILYPNWITVLNLDSNTYNSPYRPIFDWHVSNGFARISVRDEAPLCRAMLWRLATVFDYDHPEWRYSHVICRDLDSIATYREAQMVQQWVDEDKTMHCITDSISHTIPAMGGMIGLRPAHLGSVLGMRKSTGEDAWNNLLAQASDIDYKRKGSDQDFLNRIVYPRCASSATEHFIMGMPHNLIEGNGRHYSIDPNIKPEGVSDEMRDRLQDKMLAGHVGAAGFYESPTMYFLYHHDPYKEEYAELETMPEFDKIFYYRLREDLR